MKSRRRSTAIGQLVRNHGFGWVVSRLGYEAQMRVGIHERRFRQRPWDDDELARWLGPGLASNPSEYASYREANTPKFFFAPGDRERYEDTLRECLGAAGYDSLVQEAHRIRRGEFRYFSAELGDLGFPPDWHRNPFTGQRTPPSEHWSRIPMYSAHTGDLKYVWEPGRFSSAYLLARAYWASGDPIHVETFWELVESWRAANPPNHGSHWRCGQETSFRLMAWCFALYAFADSARTTPERVARLAGMIAAEADRVARDHRYAQLQRNNHAISEGVGLWTTGILFPEFAQAQQWRKQGEAILVEESERQIYSDGAYVQHSTNYHRLMLHDLLWAIELGEVNGHALPPSLRDRVRQSGDFLFQLQDEASGRVPNTGANDGALILPLDSCDFDDFRGVLGTWHFLHSGCRLYERGPWDEDLVWFFGPEAVQARQLTIEKRALSAPVGGYYTIRGADSWGMVRCPTYRDRPAQADGLHFDLWFRGTNVACDPGTYLYYAEPPWNNGLVSTGVHNTVQVDDVDQMERGPKFLWLTWLRSRVIHRIVSPDRTMAYFEGSHDGYQRLSDPVEHRRAVLADGRDTWIVVDDLIGSKEHRYRLQWLLADLDHWVDPEQRSVSLATAEQRYGLTVYAAPGSGADQRFECVRGDDLSTTRGWRSIRYGRLEPALSVTLTVSGASACRMVSIFSPDMTEASREVDGSHVVIRSGAARLEVELCTPGAESIVRQADLVDGGKRETLRVGP